MPNSLHVLTRSVFLVEFFSLFAEEYSHYKLFRYSDYKSLSEACALLEQAIVIIDYDAIKDGPNESISSIVSDQKEHKIYMGVLYAEVHREPAQKLKQQFKSISLFEKPIKKPQLLHWLQTDQARKTLNLRTEVPAENGLTNTNTMNSLSKTHGVTDYFVLSSTGETLEMSSSKAKMLYDAVNYSSQICNKIADSTGFGTLYEIRAGSPESTMSFFSTATSNSYKTFGIICDESYSMDEIINYVRSEAANE